MIKIEKNIPLPVEEQRMQWPFKDMEVGDSFALPETGEWRKLRAAAASWNSKNRSKKMRLSVVKRVEGGKTVYRCWKVAA